MSLLKQRLIVFALAFALPVWAGIAAPPVHAQTTTTTQTTPTTPTPKPSPIANFDTFLDANPAIEKDLKQNPSLLNDATYLGNHPELKAFLSSNTAISNAATSNPKALIHRLEKFERSGRDIPKADLAAFDKFLDQHSDIAKDIHKDPTLLTNATYLANHPALQSFLAANPGIQQEIAEHPRAFMHAENRFEHHEDKAERQQDKAEDKAEHQQAKVQHAGATPPSPHPMGHR
jgi:hypothetical protein